MNGQAQALRLLTDEQMRTFISQGYLILQTDFPDDFHAQLLKELDYVYDKEGNPGNNLLPRIRELQQVFDSPIIKGALTSVLGPNYMMHTHRHGHLNNTPKPGRWHKDSYWGNQRHRNHRPWWAMIMYFPQDTPVELGPTGVMPGTQYYESRTFESDDHEWEAKASGGAGTFALIHYDIWHRSTSNQMGKQRYMLKFEFMRTEHPASPSWNCADTDWRPAAALGAPIVKHDLLWESAWNWLAGKGGSLAGRAPADVAGAGAEETIARLGDADREVRAEAANRLGQAAATESAANALTGALADEFEPVRLNAAYGLAAMGSLGEARLLAALRGGGEKAAAQAAAYGLTACSPAVAKELAGLLTDADEATAGLAAFVLGELEGAGAEAVPGLVALAGSSFVEVRRTVVEALGNIDAGGQSELLVAALSGALKDEDYQVRFWAGLSLAKRGAAAAPAIPQLVGALDDSNRYVRGHAAEALRRIGTPEANEVLLDYLFASRWCPITTPQNEWYP